MKYLSIIRKKQSKRGFSLVELMLVIAILGILSVVVATKIFPHFLKSQQTVAKASIESLKTTVESFRLDNLRLPDSLQELLEPNEKLNGLTYLDDFDSLLDPWGNEYIFIPTGSQFEILSYGADGMEGGDEANKDISSIGERGNDRGY